MKRILRLILLVSAMLLVIGVLSACGNEKSYSISSVKYDPEAKLITWSDNSEAEQWIVIVNDKKKKVDETSFSFDAEDKDFTLEIEGLHKKKGHDKNPTWNGTLHYIDTPKNFVIKDGTLKWDSVSGAVKYRVYNNGNWYQEVNTPSVALPAGSFNMTVDAVGAEDYWNIYYSYKSETTSGICLPSPTSITYKNGVFSWDIVSGADFYNLTINDKKYTSSTNSFDFTGEAEDIVISVSAGSNQENSFSATPYKDTCYYLKPISEFSFNDQGNLVWDKIENATAYNIIVNGVQQSEALTTESYGNIKLDTPYTVSVIPKRTHGMSYTGEAISYSFEKLDVVKNVKFSAEQSAITWDAHSRAASYEVIIDGEKFTTTDTKYTLDQVKKDISIEVWAVGHGENSRSYFSDTVIYTYIEPVSGLTVQDGKLVWLASGKAKGYKLAFDSGSTASVEGTSYAEIQPGVQYTVKVIPTGESENCFSYWSSNFTFQVLPAPTLTYANGVVNWNGSSSVGGYSIKIVEPNSEAPIEKNLSSENYTYQDSYSKVGTYTLSLKAKPHPSSANVYESAYSAPLSITRLGATTGHEIVNSATTNNWEAVQIRFNGVNKAVGYAVFVNGAKVTETSDTGATLDLLSINESDTEHVFTVEILSTGRVTTEEVILDSLTKHSFNLTRLATPQNVRVEGKMVKWDSVSKATGYIVTVDSQKTSVKTTQYELMDLTEGSHVIKVQAISDQLEVVASRYSVPTTVNKLATPKNVQLIENDGKTLLTWNAVTNASSYKVKIGTSIVENANTNAAQIEARYLNQITEGQGMQISVWAVNSAAGYLDSEPSDTQTISRLNRPQNLGVSGDNITWNDSYVDGIKANSYKLYIDNLSDTEVAQEIALNGASYSTAELAPGQYSVYVVALGDKAKTLDSPESDKITVTKLASVTEVRITDDKLSYTWDAVPGAQKYRVTVKGNEYFVISTQFDTIDNNGNCVFDVASSYQITVTPISEALNTISGETYSFNQTVSAMTTPTYVEASEELGQYNFKIEQNGANYTITAATFADMSVKYKFTVGTTSGGETSNNICTGTMDISGWDYDVQVQFIVSQFGQDGVYYISSNPSEIKKIRC